MPAAKRVYSDDQVKAILARAIDRQRGGGSSDGLSHEDLLAVARDAGIPAEAVEAAAREVTTRSELSSDEDAVRRERRSDFRIHLYTYLLVMAFLVFVNAMTTHYPWVLWPLLGWGIALALHARFALFPTDVEIAHDAEERVKERRREDERNWRRDSVEVGARELGQAVERGLGALLSATAKRIHEHVDESEGASSTDARRVRVEEGVRSPNETANARADEDPDEAREPSRTDRRR